MHLASQFSGQRFDAVIDAYGIRELYTNCSDYLKPGKPFVTVGVAHKNYSYSGMLAALWAMVLNGLASLLPRAGQRRYLQVNAAVNPEELERLRSLVEQGKLRVPIDSCWALKDALQVRLHKQGFVLLCL